jgi:hypothetical protein
METAEPSDGEEGVTVQVVFAGNVGVPLQDIATVPLSDDSELSNSA